MEFCLKCISMTPSPSPDGFSFRVLDKCLHHPQEVLSSGYWATQPVKKLLYFYGCVHTQASMTVRTWESSKASKRLTGPPSNFKIAHPSFFSQPPSFHVNHQQSPPFPYANKIFSINRQKWNDESQNESLELFLILCFSIMFCQTSLNFIFFVVFTNKT